jgi:starch synthase
MVTTVSETYAKEIMRKEFGCGLESILRKRRKNLTGIVNGIDYSEFNPKIDTAIKMNYDIGSYDLKKANKTLLQEELGLHQTDSMVVSIISRITEQKGFDLIIGVLDKMLKHDIQFVLLGSGQKELEEKFEKYLTNPNVSITIGYDEELARRIYAGSDLFLMPSRFEPCGLSQLISYKYGTLPLVRKTGGLADTVKDVKHGGLGFVFEKYTRKALLEKFEEAVEEYGSNRWGKHVLDAMKLDFSFEAKAVEYRQLYERVMK